MTIERLSHQRVISMSAQSARDFLGGSWYMTICIGQARDPKYKFGARIYLLFKTKSDYEKYKKFEMNK